MPQPTGGPGVKHLLRRASWSLVDQGLSAASNLLLSVIIATLAALVGPELSCHHSHGARLLNHMQPFVRET